ncbi:MFS transporter [candidate division WOR-3 bacterium]|nr:MFS transporter [candidate division WOR-3 bacterium]
MDRETEERQSDPLTETVQEELADVERSSRGRRGLFRNKAFQLFSASQGASLLGDKLGYMALLGMVFALFPQASSQVLGVISIVIGLPTLILGPFFLLLVDRWPRRTVLIISDVARLAMTVGGPLLIMLVPTNVLPHFWVMIVFLLIYFTFNFTFNTVRLSIIPDIVDTKHLHGANSFLNLLNRLATLVGIAGGGILIDLAIWDRIGIPGWGVGFFADGATFAISVVALLSLRVKSHIPAYHHKLEEATEKITGGFKAMVEALKLIVLNPVLLAGVGSIIQFGVFNAVILVLMIPIVETHLELGLLGVGIMGLFVGLGFVLGSAVYGLFGKRIPKTQLIFICYGVVGLCLGLVALIPSAITIGVVAFLGGLLYTIINTAHDTLIHEEVPNVIRGRIFSAREWLYMFTFMVSSLLLGASAYVAHPYFLMAVCAGFFVVTCLGGLVLVWVKVNKKGSGKN